MKTAEARKTLRELDSRGRAVFSAEDLRVIFPELARKNFSKGLNRLVREGVLQRAARGVFVNPVGWSRIHVLDQIAVKLRHRSTSYLSLESALGHYSIISQQTTACATVMTTGSEGRFDTPYGTVAFTHTSRSVDEILARTVDTGHPLRLAHPRLALEDRKRVNWDVC